MNDWINIQDKLPKAMSLVLLTNGFSIRTICWTGDRWVDHNTFFNKPPTHWMPLPDLPK